MKKPLMGTSAIGGGLGLVLMIISWATGYGGNLGTWLFVAGLVGLIIGTLLFKE